MISCDEVKDILQSGSYLVQSCAWMSWRVFGWSFLVGLKWSRFCDIPLEPVVEDRTLHFHCTSIMWKIKDPSNQCVSPYSRHQENAIFQTTVHSCMLGHGHNRKRYICKQIDPFWQKNMIEHWWKLAAGTSTVTFGRDILNAENAWKPVILIIFRMQCTKMVSPQHWHTLWPVVGPFAHSFEMGRWNGFGLRGKTHLNRPARFIWNEFAKLIWTVGAKRISPCPANCNWYTLAHGRHWRLNQFRWQNATGTVRDHLGQQREL